MDNLKLPIYESEDGYWETTKVKDLIEALSKCNPEALVFLEGCECTGSAVGIRFNNDNSIEII